MTKAHTWSMSLSFQLVEGLPERASLSTDVRPSLNQLYHSLMCVMPMALSPKSPLNLPNGFHLAIAKLLVKYDAIPLLESFRHFRRK
jgi:outer membrane cobalamin receptor